MDVDLAGIDALAVEGQAAANVQTTPRTQAAAPRSQCGGDPQTRRLMRIRVPVIARLADRTMSIRTVRAIAPGSIIEFDRSVETPVEVLINRHVIGRARVVKVGEYFGLRVTETVDRTQRIASLGG